jgi:hypothetical protein
VDVDVQLKPDIPDRSGPDQHEPIIFDGIYDRYDHLLVSSCFGVCFFGIGLDASGRIWTHLDS